MPSIVDALSSERLGRSYRRRNRGVVLLTTLMLLVLVALAMVAAARASGAAALAADQAAREVQARWAATSCQYTLLPAAERLLQHQETATRGPATCLSASLTLGNVDVDVVLSDEEAKSSVPALLARRGDDRNQAAADLRRLLAPSGAAGLLRLREMPANTSRVKPGNDIGPGGPRAMGLGEVFDLTRPEAIDRVCPSTTSRSTGASAVVTCWGGGRLNWRRADDAALRLMLCPPMTYSEVAQLEAARRADQGGRVSLSQVLDRMDLNGAARGVADAALVDGSACHGLWITARPAAPRGDKVVFSSAGSASAPILRRQAVWDESEPGLGVLCFDW